MEKIIFISGTPISKVVGEKIDPYWYQEQGYIVEYWGLQSIYYDHSAIDAYFSGNKDYRYIFPNSETISSRMEVARKLKGLDKDTIICFIDFGLQRDYWLLLLFKKYNVQYYIGPRSVTFQGKDGKTAIRGNWYLLKKIFSKSFKKKIYQILFQKLYKHSQIFQKPEFVFCCGSKGYEDFSNVVNESNYISIPSAEVCWRKSEKLVEREYCVYVENSFHNSPDLALNQDKNEYIKLKSFEKNICRAFDLIEKELGCSVIIAASGKYIYPDDKVFGGRKVIYYKSNQLIEHSKLVIGHFSAGLAQAITSYKPILLLQDTSFSSLFIEMTNNVGANLGITPVAISSLIGTFLNDLSVDQEKYDLVIQRYFNDSDTETDSKLTIAHSISRLL
jgi:hypothetical protein